MPHNPRDQRIIDRLMTILTLCEVGGLPGKSVDVDSEEVQKVYLLVLGANRIDAEMLDAATADILSERFFPTPGAIVDRCRPHRDRIEAERSANRYKGWVDCIDPRGGDMIAPPSDVRDGEYAPGMGNGVPLVGPAPLQADDTRLKAILEGKSGSPLSLSMRNVHEREPIGAEKEAELIEEARRNADRRRSGG